MREFSIFLARRLAFVVPQLLGILIVSFLLIKTIPGDPAVLMLGPTATHAAIDALRAKLGLNQPLPVQFLFYLNNLLHGNLGSSWQTTRPVIDDLLHRFPATLELVIFGLVVAILIGVPLGIAAAVKERGWIARATDLFGVTAGAVPDFWLALMLVFVFYTLLHLAPAPLGRIGLTVIPPPPITGFLTLDSLIAGDWPAFVSSVSHLCLPVLTLGLIYSVPILRMTQSTMERMLHADFSRYEVLCGLPHHLVVRHALRNALPSVITIVSVLFGYLLGGAVLIEIVFSWGGAGQYAVQGVLNSDINPVLGFVIFAAVLSLIVYLLVDIVYFIIDPRIGR